MDGSARLFLVWVIFGIAGQINIVTGFDACFDRRNSLGVFCVYFFIKNCITTRFVAANPDGQEDPAVVTVWIILVTVFAIASFIVMWYTWNAEPIKIGIAGILSDPLTGASTIIAGLCMNRISNGVFINDFSMLSLKDAVIGSVISVLMYTLLIKLLHRPIRFLRTYEIQHRRLMTAVIIACISGFSVSNYGTTENINTSLAVAYIFVLMILMISLLVMSRRLRADINRKALLMSRREIMDAYMIAIEEQSRSVEAQRQILDSIGERIEEAEKNNRIAELEIYLHEMMRQVEELRTGVYSSISALDAVLSYFAVRMRNEGIETVFRIADIGDCGQKASELCMMLLGWAERYCDKQDEAACPGTDRQAVTLELIRGGNQLICEMRMPAVKKRFSAGYLAGCIEAGDTVTDVYRDGSKVISVMTEVREW